MVPKTSHLACFVLGLIALLFAGCASQPGIPIYSADYSFLRHPEGAKAVRWRKYEGPDFDVFYGQFIKDRKSGFGFYLGGHPQRSASASNPTNETLGAFAVHWRETCETNPPLVCREAVFDYRNHILRFKDREQKRTTKVHVWVYSPSRSGADEVTHFLGGLALFRTKPEDEVRVVK